MNRKIKYEFDSQGPGGDGLGPAMGYADSPFKTGTVSSRVTITPRQPTQAEQERDAWFAQLDAYNAKLRARNKQNAQKNGLHV